MGRRGPTVRGVVSRGSALFALAVALVLLLPAGSVATGSARPSATVLANCPGVQASYGIVANVTWNGVNVCGSTNQSAALGVDFTQTASVVYNWKAAGTSTLTLNDARLQMYYFGFSVVTRDITQTGATPQSSGTFTLNWNPGALTYVFEGLFGLTASLLAPNGTTVWSENFFVKATAPYAILAALPLILIILAIWELYSVARSGRQAVLSGKGKPPTAPPKEEAPTETAAPEPPPESPAPPEEPPGEETS
jgi:hypothetical protein